MKSIGIIALVPEPWDDLPMTARHHLAERLAEHFPVVWVDPLLRPWQDCLRSALRPPQSSTPKREAPRGLTILRANINQPKIYRPQWLGTMIERNRLQAARRILVAQGVRQVVVYLWRPEFAPALDMVAHDLSCYHIDDEYSFSNVQSELDPKEVALIRRADQVVIHSRALMERKGMFNPHTVLVPNGVDYLRFSSPQAEPEDIRHIPHPRAGYVGVIKRHLDLDLMVEVADRLPQVSFVFVGPELSLGDQAGAVRALKQRSNCHFLGGRDSATLPAYMQHLDVGLLCYRSNDYTKYIYPLKLHEYLAAGLPVVASPIPALQEFEGIVKLVNTADEWAEAITGAVSEPSGFSARVAQGRKVAQQHDWRRLVGLIADVIRSRLGEHSDVQQSGVQV